MTYPLITLSTRAQVDAKGEHRSFTAALKKILDKEGIPGLYSGLKSALFGIGITNGTTPHGKETEDKGSITSGMNGVNHSLRMLRLNQQVDVVHLQLPKVCSQVSLQAPQPSFSQTQSG